VRRELGVADGEKIVAVPDGMVRGAGHEMASWAHAIVRQVTAGAVLLFPGTGGLADRVRSFAATTGYDAEVHFTEDRHALSEVLAAADVAAFLHERPVGVLALAAAMAAGVAGIASRTPAIAECVDHEQEALLVAPSSPRQAAAALLRLVEDPGLACRLAAGARRRAASAFDPVACRTRLDEIYAAATQP
jgi:glycosyltransferase involved in cell wall biosynthesis